MLLAHLLLAVMDAVSKHLAQTFSVVLLVWATLLGWLIFGDLPDASTFTGMAIIIGSGLALYFTRRAIVQY